MWANTNKMTFNTSKFEHLHFGQPEDISYTTPSGTQITNTGETRDLGITMSESLQFTNQIKNIVSKAKCMSGWIQRTFFNRQPGLMKILLKSLVISNLEYGAALWSPSTPGSIAMIENIQRNFTSKIISFKT